MQHTTLVKPLTYGRMGNFLFQVATAIGYAATHKLEFTVPNVTSNPLSNPVYLPHLINPHWNSRLPFVTLEEQGHAFQELPFQEEWRGQRNVILDGYWQTEKYFLHCRQLVLDAFGYPWQCRQGFVSVHVRRGDYLRLRHKHPPVPAAWYNDAMDRFPDCFFHFFSDDIQWCKDTFGGRPRVVFSRNQNDPEQDLIEMSQCEHHICSASTFSWWGAWLNRNPAKKIIIPKEWFVPGSTGLDTSDIVPSSWIKV